MLSMFVIRGGDTDHGFAVVGARIGYSCLQWSQKFRFRFCEAALAKINFTERRVGCPKARRKPHGILRCEFGFVNEAEFQVAARNPRHGLCRVGATRLCKAIKTEGCSAEIIVAILRHRRVEGVRWDQCRWRRRSTLSLWHRGVRCR